MVLYGVIFVDDIKVIDNIQTRIDQDIKFVDAETWKVYEHYTFNKKTIKRQLGFFNDPFDYVPIVQLAFEDRRSDLNGYNIKAITESLQPYVSIDLASSTFDEASQTYDVTKSVTGMFYDIFLNMQEYLNFTFTLHKRKDGKWGPTEILANGTIVTAGIIESVTSGFAEMCATR